MLYEKLSVIKLPGPNAFRAYKYFIYLDGSVYISIDCKINVTESSLPYYHNVLTNNYFVPLSFPKIVK